MKYISAQEILYIHSRVVDSLGGKHGVLNPKVIKKAVTYSHNNEMFADCFAKSAALMFAISRKKPFSDMNTPTSIVVAQTFLRINGSELDISDPEITTFSKALLPKATLEEIKNFLTAKSTPIKN